MSQISNIAKIQVGDTLPPIVKQISQQRINWYAEASGDFNPIHINEDFAKKTPFGGTIAHGMLVLSFTSALMSNVFGAEWISRGTLSARFKAAARPGDIITTTGTVTSIEYQNDIHCIKCSVESRNQAGEIVITGNTTVKLPSNDASNKTGIPHGQ